MDNQIYFANKNDDELLDELHSRIDQYYDFLGESGIHNVWKRSTRAWYGSDLNQDDGTLFDSARLRKGGSVGEITKSKINHYKNLVKNAINLATANKTSLNCTAGNLDYKSQAQTVLGDSILDYYLSFKDVFGELRTAVRYACLHEGWIHSPWAPEKGELYDKDEDGKPIFEGDLDITSHTGWDVIRDTSLRHNNHRWLILRKRDNKFDLAARYPKFKDEILNTSTHEYEEYDSFRLNMVSDTDTSEEIPIYTMYHEPTDSVEEGRLVVFTKNLILFDGPLPYDSIPLEMLKPELLDESCFAWSPFVDLLNIQQAHDNLSSTVLSNNLSFGLQFLWKQKGGNFDVTDLDGGMKLIESDEKPEALNFTKSAPETYNYLQSLETYMEKLSNISAAVRGDAPASWSGSAIATVIAQSVQFGSALEESFNNLLERVGTQIIEHLRAFAKTPRIALISGISNRPYLKSFTSQDISDIKRVTVQKTNAMSKTIAGRLELAGQVSQMTPEQAKTYIHVLNTGQLPSEFQVPSETMNIKAENEAMQNGQDVSAVITENHAAHIQHHKSVLENPEAKEDDELVARVLGHIQEHINLARTMDPALAQILGYQPVAPAPQPQAPSMSPPSIAGQPGQAKDPRMDQAQPAKSLIERN